MLAVGRLDCWRFIAEPLQIYVFSQTGRANAWRLLYAVSQKRHNELTSAIITGNGAV